MSPAARGMTVTRDMVGRKVTLGRLITTPQVAMARMPATRATLGMAVTADMVIMSGSFGGCFG
jgi:hypothetical protein